MEWAKLIAEILGALGVEIVKAISKGDWSVLDKPISEILPKTLRITLVRKRAEAEAEAKFGPKTKAAVKAPPRKTKATLKPSARPRWGAR